MMPVSAMTHSGASACIDTVSPSCFIEAREEAMPSCDAAVGTLDFVFRRHFQSAVGEDDIAFDRAERVVRALVERRTRFARRVVVGQRAVDPEAVALSERLAPLGQHRGQRRLDFRGLGVAHHVVQRLFDSQEQVVPHIGGQLMGRRLLRQIEPAADPRQAQIVDALLRGTSGA